MGARNRQSVAINQQLATGAQATTTNPTKSSPFLSMNQPTQDKPKPPPEIIKEACYRMNERLGILCDTAEPTPEQLRLAEADYWATIQQWRSGVLKP